MEDQLKGNAQLTERVSNQATDGNAREYLAIRPSGCSGWALIGETQEGKTWSLLHDELRAIADEESPDPLQTKLVELTLSEVSALEEFGGW